jgi:hypothetical protein
MMPTRSTKASAAGAYPDTDSDSDGTADCIDNCPDDACKVEEGVCGCGDPDADLDSDGVPDCIDNCPDDAGKVEEGICGCGDPDADLILVHCRR